MLKGLKESVKLKWSGDVDLNDGQLQKQYEEYLNRLESVKKAALVPERASSELTHILEDTVKDLKYVHMYVTTCIHTTLTRKTHENGRVIHARITAVKNGIATHYCSLV